MDKVLEVSISTLNSLHDVNILRNYYSDDGNHWN